VDEPVPQIKLGVRVAVTVGLGLTKRLTVWVEVHAPLRPVIVYTVVDVGVTVTELPFKEPGIQV
jgi:hypothetical protein